MTPTDLEAVRKRDATRLMAMMDCEGPSMAGAMEDVAKLLAHINTPPDQATVEEVAKVVYAVDPTINWKTGPVPWDDYPAAKGQPMPGRKRIAYDIATALLQRFPGLGSGWKDSKSAPTDGNEFIGWDSVHHFAVYDLFHKGDRFISRGTRWSGHFSHWMPSLPSPPVGEK